MKRNNKKGFTIVELVIVIAVIAILSAVLIPTFGGITTEAKNTARDLDAKNVYTEYLADAKGEALTSGLILVDGKNYAFENGQLNLKETDPENGKTYTYVWCDNHTDAENTTTDEIEHNELCNNCKAKIECVDKDCDHNKQ